jgi:hypothetical protein
LPPPDTTAAAPPPVDSEGGAAGAAAGWPQAASSMVAALVVPRPIIKERRLKRFEFVIRERTSSLAWLQVITSGQSYNTQIKSDPFSGFVLPAR